MSINRNAEGFGCLNYLGFIQNVLGRLRTMTTAIMVLLIVSTVPRAHTDKKNDQDVSYLFMDTVYELLPWRVGF
jgi:hypothetical protein